MPDRGNQILIVDDEANVRESLRMILSRVYQVETAESADRALDILRERAAGDEDLPDLVILDVYMPGIDGIELLEHLREEFTQMPVIMLTASTAVQTAVRAMKIGAVDYLSKPYDVDELLSLISETLEQGPTGRSAPSSLVTADFRRNDLCEVEGDFGSLTGISPCMQQLYKKIEQLAARDTTVLITGESGTGKELVAREIHRRSARSSGPFVALNCAAIPETLIESELFGHEKGSFTHAIEKRIGHFELADKGTLFLDEIGELSLPVQVKMLRFLQEQEFYRVGQSKPTRVDVRIVAATNRSLESAIREGVFREDLYYRINVVSLEIPPLRQRVEDIPRLVSFFTERLAPLYGGRHPRFSEETLRIMEHYPWPGNVRELENVTESILALSSSEVIEPGELPARIRGEHRSGDLKEQVLQGEIPFEEAERVFETELIVRALKKTGYVQTRAAELLGISRRILKYKMDKLGISDKPPS